MFLFKEAYDDCECALEQGYPIDNIHKIILRQAKCALELNDIVRLKFHLDALENLELDQNYTEQMKNLKNRLHEIKNNPLVPKLEVPQPNLQRDTQKM